MAKTEVRTFIIHKQDKYDRFIQAGFKNAGIAMGKLDKVGGKNLYWYLMSNANNIDFELKVANYANWLGDPMYDEDGVKNGTKSAKYRNQVKEGITQLIEAGYLIEKYPGVYEFFEGGIKTDNSECNKNDDLEQIVSEKTDFSESNKLLQSKEKIIVLKQIVSNETNLDESNNLSQKEESVTCQFDF